MNKKSKYPKLLPCPFCWNEVEFHPQEHHIDNMWNKNTIYCPTCDFRMEGTSWVELFKRWNTRKSMEYLVECLEKEVDPMDLLGPSWDSRETRINKFEGLSDGIKKAINIIRKVGMINDEK